MKKSIGLSLVAATLLAGNAAAMELGGGTLGGDARVQYFGTTPTESDATSSVGLGLNPEYSMEIASGLSFEVGAGVAVPVTESDDLVAAGNTHAKLNEDDNESASYAVLNKLNVTYNFGDGFVKVGAQDLETPLAGPDDIRLVRNTFTAAVVAYTGIKNTTLIGAQVTSMAGAFDGGADDSEQYQSMSTQALGSGDDVDDQGVTALAAIYGDEEAGMNGQVWYYSMPDTGAQVGTEDIGAVSAMYLDAGMAFGDVNVAAQYISFATGLYSNSSVGVMADASFGDFGVMAAMNTYSFTDDGLEDAAGAAIVGTPAYYGWGGYPEYAVADEVWANSADWDGGSSTKIGVSYSGIENLDLSVASVNFTGYAGIVDIIAGYTVNEQISAGLTYETVTYDQEDADENDGHTVLKFGASYAF